MTGEAGQALRGSHAERRPRLLHSLSRSPFPLSLPPSSSSPGPLHRPTLRISLWSRLAPTTPRSHTTSLLPSLTALPPAPSPWVALLRQKTPRPRPVSTTLWISLGRVARDSSRPLSPCSAVASRPTSLLPQRTAHAFEFRSHSGNEEIESQLKKDRQNLRNEIKARASSLGLTRPLVRLTDLMPLLLPPLCSIRRLITPALSPTLLGARSSPCPPVAPPSDLPCFDTRSALPGWQSPSRHGHFADTRDVFRRCSCWEVRQDPTPFHQPPRGCTAG